jgi:hypothetical protein
MNVKIYSGAEFLARDLPPPRRRDVPRIELSSEPVKIRGEELGEIWWRGKQWAVTSHGIEALDGCYFIAKDRFAEDLPEYSWPEHMAGKNWVDADEFATAWLLAIFLHGRATKVKLDDIRNAIKRLPAAG